MVATLVNKLRWSYRKNVPDLLALLRRNYPAFMLSRHPKPVRNEIPVFAFHTVEPISFEKKLQFLARNGYCTLSGEEFRAAAGRPALRCSRSFWISRSRGGWRESPPRFGWR